MERLGEGLNREELVALLNKSANEKQKETEQLTNLQNENKRLKAKTVIITRRVRRKKILGGRKAMALKGMCQTFE